VNECLEEMHAGEVCRVSIHPCQELQDHLKKFKTSEKLAADYQIELISFEKVVLYVVQNISMSMLYVVNRIGIPSFDSLLCRASLSNYK
jgi:hypothetical protein